MNYVLEFVSFAAAAFAGLCFGLVWMDSAPYRGIAREYVVGYTPVVITMALWLTAMMLILPSHA